MVRRCFLQEIIESRMRKLQSENTALNSDNKLMKDKLNRSKCEFSFPSSNILYTWTYVMRHAKTRRFSQVSVPR